MGSAAARDIYVVRPDGTGLRRVNEPGNFCGSPKFSSDGTRLLAYCMPIESTLETRRPNPLPGNDTTLVSIDIATGKVSDIPAGPGVKISPAFLPGNDIGYVRKDSSDAGIYYTSGKRGPRGNVRVAAWSPDGSRVVFHRRQVAPPTSWLKGFTGNPNYEIAFSSAAAVVQSIGRPVRDGRAARWPRPARLEHPDRLARRRRGQDHLQGHHAQRPWAAVVSRRQDDPVRRRHLSGVLQRFRQPDHESRSAHRRRRADRDDQSRWQRIPRNHERRQQQRLPFDVARRQADRLSNVRTGRRRPAHHEHRDARDHHADQTATTTSRSGRRAAIASSFRASPTATTRSIRLRRTAPARSA